MTRSFDREAVDFGPVQRGDLPHIRQLLDATGLPHADITEAGLASFLCARSGAKLVGIVGLEPLGDEALVRSLAVASTHRGRGVATELLQRIEQVARRRRALRVYALTQTIEGLLLRRGYVRIARETAPQSIRNTTEFRGLCPDTAVLLAKDLGRPS